VAEKMWKVLNR